MLEKITFKTELSEIITIEEVTILFDTIRKKYETELISLSLFPRFNQIKKEIIEKTIKQRNAELSKLLMEIASRKQEIKINMWKILSAIGTNKKNIQNNKEKAADLEQIIYEEEQIINVYENSIRTLERKEKKIMNGKYSRVDKVKPLSRKRSLKKLLEELKNRIISISTQHDDCFIDYEKQLEELVDGTIITAQSAFSKYTSSLTTEQKSNLQSIVIEDDSEVEDNKISYVHSQQNKDFYLYEPNQEDLDDELIYQLLAQSKYNDKDGTINGLSISHEFVEYEEV